MNKQNNNRDCVYVKNNILNGLKLFFHVSQLKAKGS